MLLLGAWLGCTVPSLNELGDKRCDLDAGRVCIDPYQCISGLCRIPGGGECTAGATELCGKDAGECVLGTRTCGADNRWSACEGDTAPSTETCDGKDNDCDAVVDNGVQPSTEFCERSAKGICNNVRRACVDGGFETPCSSASYGALYEASEATCDGQDNDCDGTIDKLPDAGELRAGPCDLQLGICAASARVCAAGQFESTCTAASYGPAFEPVELRCDGIDNDCNDEIDSSRAVKLAPGPSGHAGIAAVDGGYFALYVEELDGGSRLIHRRFSADFTPMTAPLVINAPGAASVRSPVIVPIGNAGEVMASWVEDLPNGTTRLMLTRVDPNGGTFISGSAGQALPVVSRSTVPVGDIALAVDRNGVQALIAWVEKTDAGQKLYGVVHSTDGLTATQPETVLVESPNDGGTEEALEVDAVGGSSATQPFVLLWTSTLNGAYGGSARAHGIFLQELTPTLRIPTASAGAQVPLSPRIARHTSLIAAGWIEIGGNGFGVRFISDLANPAHYRLGSALRPRSLDLFASGSQLFAAWSRYSAARSELVISPFDGGLGAVIATLPGRAIPTYVQATARGPLGAVAFEYDGGIELDAVSFCAP